MNGEHSTSTLVCSGVPQGSVWDNYFFSSTSMISPIFISLKSQPCHSMLMTCCYTSLSPLIISPMLKFSETSTVYFSGLRRTCCLSTSPNANVSCLLTSVISHSNNQPLQYVQHYKYLGVTVSHNLSWTQGLRKILTTHKLF